MPRCETDLEPAGGCFEEFDDELEALIETASVPMRNRVGITRRDAYLIDL